MIRPVSMMCVDVSPILGGSDTQIEDANDRCSLSCQLVMDRILWVRKDRETDLFAYLITREGGMSGVIGDQPDKLPFYQGIKESDGILLWLFGLMHNFNAQALAAVPLDRRCVTT